jgi:hypothetical protein
MAVADKIMALLDTMTIASLDSLPPARRQQFAQLCQYWGRVADAPPKGPPGTFQQRGILADLIEGGRE